MLVIHLMIEYKPNIVEPVYLTENGKLLTNKKSVENLSSNYN